MPLGVGDIAPDFTLKDNHGKDMHLADFRGKKIVLGFHPFAWTKVCAEQMQDLEDRVEIFQRHNAVAFGISIDSTFCKKAWAESLGVSRTRLLSDFWPHGAICMDYDLFNDELGASRRATVILDEKGVVRWMKVYPNPQRPDIDEIVTEVEKV
jgi:peroxiredoxin